MITKVVKSAWTNPNGKAGFCYRVYHKIPSRIREREYTYTDKQNLPMTVLDYVLNAKNCRTVYVPDEDCSGGRRGLKREIYTN